MQSSDQDFIPFPYNFYIKLRQRPLNINRIKINLISGKKYRIVINCEALSRQWIFRSVQPHHLEGNILILSRAWKSVEIIGTEFTSVSTAIVNCAIAFLFNFVGINSARSHGQKECYLFMYNQQNINIIEYWDKHPRGDLRVHASALRSFHFHCTITQIFSSTTPIFSVQVRISSFDHATTQPKLYMLYENIRCR